jgi:hypothetical protein
MHIKPDLPSKIHPNSYYGVWEAINQNLTNIRVSYNDRS